MTVIELRELLSGYDDEVQVFMKIESIVDNYGNYIDGFTDTINIVSGPMIILLPLLEWIFVIKEIKWRYQKLFPTILHQNGR